MRYDHEFDYASRSESNEQISKMLRTRILPFITLHSTKTNVAERIHINFIFSINHRCKHLIHHLNNNNQKDYAHTCRSTDSGMFFATHFFLCAGFSPNTLVKIMFATVPVSTVFFSVNRVSSLKSLKMMLRVSIATADYLFDPLRSSWGSLETVFYEDYLIVAGHFYLMIVYCLI